ncbi:hypothetical protein AYI87_19870 [Shewanella sp. KCT]|nr:hypothetical protein AYI87_19870 [Shewanella sp. KCT]
MVDNCILHNRHFHRPWWSYGEALAFIKLSLMQGMNVESFDNCSCVILIAAIHGGMLEAGYDRRLIK